MKLAYSQQRRRFELRFRDFHEYQKSQGLPKRLGFYWDPEHKVWHTTDTRAAAKLLDYGDRDCKARLNREYMQGQNGLRTVLSFQAGEYTYRCPHSMESIPRLLAFDYNRRSGLWYTHDDFLALKLLKHADAQAKERLLEFRAEYRRRLKLSRAADAEIVIPSPDGFSYMPFQCAGIAYIRELQAALIGDEMGLGKAQPLDAEILTPSGYRQMKDIEVGDMVIAADGQKTSVQGVYPQAKQDIYRVTFSDGTSAECTRDHLWEVNTPLRKYYSKPSLVLTIDQILEKGLRTSSGNRKWFIPISEPIAGEIRNLPLHPYALGVLLGDGKLATGSPMISNPESDILARLESYLPNGYTLKRVYPDKHDYRITGNSNKRSAIIAILQELDLRKQAPKKRIPKLYLYASRDQREELLRGLLDTDGSYLPGNGALQFYSSSEGLINDVRHLVESLGGIARKNCKPAGYRNASGEYIDCLPAWSLTISLPPSVRPFYCKRKRNIYRPRTKYFPARAIESIDFIGYKECQCIAIASPRKLYLTNSCICTHNTIMALGLINLLAAELGDVLVVCPASLKINWQSEARRWLTSREYDIQIAGARHFPVRGMFKRFVIVNYDVLHKHQAELGREPWGLVIADEAHRVKNPNTIRAKAFMQIPAERKLLLTGTPIVNRPSELWPLLNYLDPDRYGSRKMFLARYCGGKAKGAQHLDELQKRLRGSVMVRRLKCDVLTELPPKLRQVIELPADEELLARERLVLSRLGLLVEGEATADPVKFAEQVGQLKRGSMGAAAEIARIRHETALAKVPQVIDHVKGCLEQVSKVLLFAHHKDVVAALMAAFGNQAVKLTGDCSTQERQQAVERFQEDPAVRVFVGSIMAAGVGLTLTAANHVVFAELDWVPGNMNQAEDRCHRIGQHNSVTVQHLVLQGSLDAYISRMLIDKQEVIDRSLDRREVRTA